MKTSRNTRRATAPARPVSAPLYRVVVWCADEPWRTMYGVQRRTPDAWADCTIKNGLLIYPTREAADQAVEWFNNPVGPRPYQLDDKLPRHD